MRCTNRSGTALNVPDGDVLSGGPPSYNPSLTEVSQPFSNGVEGCDYYFIVNAPTNIPNKTLTMYGLIAVRN